DALRRLSAARAAGAGGLFSRRAELHRGDLRHQGGRAADRCGARPGAGHLRHQPARGALSGDDEHWDFGLGAGFYVDAVQAPWSSAYRMHSWVAFELPALIEASFPVRAGARSIFGHSMGGHGALTIALTHPDRYRSVSAFAPIVAPSRVPWGQ